MRPQTNLFRVTQKICAGLTAAAYSLMAASLTVPSSNGKTISEAIFQAADGDTIWVEPGVYREQIATKAGTVLISRELFKAVIDGKGRGNVVTLAGNSAIIGFDIRNGAAGVFCRSAGAAVRKCRIYRNRGSGIICAGSLPVLEDNIIVYNEASGIQTLEIAAGAPVIAHNTIAYNANHGIAISGAASLKIENNIIAFNRGIGVKTEPESQDITLSYNLLYDNHGKIFVTTQETYSFDPQFTAPKRRQMDFSLMRESQAIKRGNDNQNLGARINGH